MKHVDMSRSQHAAMLARPGISGNRFSLAEIYPDVRPDEFEKHTFHVQSRSEGRGNYKVYVDAYEWNGMCNCQNFDFRMRPELERGAKPSDGLRCWHIQKARAYYLDELGRAMDAVAEKNTNTKGNNEAF